MATRRWLGAAADVVDLWTGTVGGTWATSDTVTVTINNKSVTGIVGTVTTVVQVLELIKNLFQSLADDLGAGESYAPTEGGQSIPEFTEYTAAVASSTTITFTANVAGRPGTISVAKSSTSGTFTITNTTAATGKYFFGNQDNWSGNTAPVNDDVVVFDAGSTDVLYGLSTGLTGLTIKVLEGYTGKIGLPERNGSGSLEYDEYRAKYLTTAGGTTTVEIDNGSLQRCRIAFGANTAVVVIRNTGQRAEPRVPAVLLTGGDGSSTLAITKGDVGLAFYAGETAQLTTLDISYRSSQASDATVIGGTGLTLATCNKSGGVAEFNANITTLTQFPNGGSVTIWAGLPATANIDGGTLIYNSTGNVSSTAWRVTGDGFVDFDQDPRGKTCSNPIDMHGERARIRDTKKVVASLVVDLNYSAKAANIERGSNNRLTFGTPA